MRRRRSICFGVSLASIMLVGGLAACGDDDDDDEASTTTTEASTTSTTTEASTTTIEATTTTVEAVVAWIQDRLVEEYAEADPTPGIVGPSQIRCSDTGEVAVGSVIVCDEIPNEQNTLLTESGSAVVYVLDGTGRAAWSTATEPPATTADLQTMYEQSPYGLLCRELMTPGVAPFPFDLSGTTPETGFLWALVYWSLEGEPDRMDEDGNGIPCETVFDAQVVAKVLAGGRV